VVIVFMIIVEMTNVLFYF